MGRQPVRRPPPDACGDPAPSCETDAAEQQMLERLNPCRIGRGLPALALASTLMQAARAKAAALGEGPLVHDDATRIGEQQPLDCGASPMAGFGEILGCETEGPDQWLWPNAPWLCP